MSELLGDGNALASHSWETIRAGSKSFAAAARILDPGVRESASMLYAWCRYCDDVIDEQSLGHGRLDSGTTPAARLEHLRRMTRRAIAGEPIDDPAFAALQTVAARHHIPEVHAFELLDGFAMDVEQRTYRTLEDTLEYCYHVAGVVGVMMAMVMGVRDRATLDRAADLGIALQLTNIARDVIDDAQIGRVYLPRDWLAAAGVDAGAVASPEARQRVFTVTARLLDAAEPYYRSADSGIACLPWRSAWGIATARSVYHRIGARVRARGATAWDTRVIVPGYEKALLAAGAALTSLRLVATRTSRQPQPRTGLWTRP